MKVSWECWRRKVLPTPYTTLNFRIGSQGVVLSSYKKIYFDLITTSDPPTNPAGLPPRWLWPPVVVVPGSTPVSLPFVPPSFKASTNDRLPVLIKLFYRAWRRSSMALGASARVVRALSKCWLLRWASYKSSQANSRETCRGRFAPNYALVKTFLFAI